MQAQITGKMVPNPAAALPSLDELRGAPREIILQCLDTLGRLGEQGIRPPDGYLFALSREIVRPRAGADAAGPGDGDRTA
ncbi:hypothetical protein [Caldimonas tepidiphila]|uniref:hypothetical protein n=1 Tax=Caldimonas tepidiphila TaxID=2315841 RepID=UPI000E5AFDA5|nr:hypothetical protein [Caldimonas tepidiphila]